ncbi:hypothetical protein ST47_g9108 [Ascochyta rabiei]|uniref:WSC domain-containing protein n=1 Tax=Didymella rabiei TaxID=5454 RepID=A0A162XKZ7_DIDRA|nr:hypothetical protein ST47_g9108 [Ascochyta rabiei]
MPLRLTRRLTFLRPNLIIDFTPNNYSGCYEDAEAGTNLGLLSGPAQTNTVDLTHESCQSFCTTTTGGPYRYFGLEAGTQCRCGNDFQHSATPLDGSATGCETPCSGDATQRCGGINRISVYANNDFLSLPVGVTPTSTPIGEPTPVDLPEPIDVSLSTPTSEPTPVDLPEPIDVSLSTPTSEPTPIVDPNQTSTPGAVPSATRLPLLGPLYPNRPPTEAGDSVDVPYFGAQPIRGGQPGGNNGRPRPRPATTARPWKPRPTKRPWERNRAGPIARAERRWFGLW